MSILRIRKGKQTGRAYVVWKCCVLGRAFTIGGVGLRMSWERDRKGHEMLSGYHRAEK